MVFQGALLRPETTIRQRKDFGFLTPVVRRATLLSLQTNFHKTGVSKNAIPFYLAAP